MKLRCEYECEQIHSSSKVRETDTPTAMAPVTGCKAWRVGMCGAATAPGAETWGLLQVCESNCGCGAKIWHVSVQGVQDVVGLGLRATQHHGGEQWLLLGGCSIIPFSGCFRKWCCYSVTKYYLTLCNLLDWSTPGSSVLPEFVQTHPLSRWCSLNISSSATHSPFTYSLSQHQGLFQWVPSLYHVAKVLKLQLQDHSVLPVNIRVDFL